MRKWRVNIPVTFLSLTLSCVALGFILMGESWGLVFVLAGSLIHLMFGWERINDRWGGR